MKESEKTSNTNQTKNILIAAGAGMALGAIAGLLFAPKSGKELRKDIAETTSSAVDTVSSATSETVNKAKEIIQNAPVQGKSKLAEAARTVKQIAETMEHSLNGNA
ncbi:MAG: YtxH domain-containing protein [Flavobacteriales bacterium]|nr:YtxH domain-containing protein [Flavobacteriales bacterium]